MRGLSFLILIMILAGCGEGRPAPAVAPPVVVAPATVGKLADATPPAKDEAQAKESAAEARAQMAFWKARLDVAEAEGKRLAAEERQRWLEKACRWVMVLCLMGLLGSMSLFAASFVWPWFARLRYVALAGAGAALVVFCAVWWLPTAVHWFGLAALAMSVAGGVVLFWHAHGHGKQVDLNTKIRAALTQLGTG